MFIQFFSSHFSERIFCFLCLNSSKCRYVYFQKQKLISARGKIQNKTVKKKKTKEKYLHSIHRVVIKRNIFSELGHSSDRCLAVPLDSVIGKSWDPISQQLKMVQAIISETSCVLPFPHVVCPISRQGHLLRSSY